MIVLWFAFITILIVNGNTILGDVIGNSSSLQLVQVIFRHGDRTPLDKGETFLNVSDWPEGYGQLTNLGKQHGLELGELLRNLYSEYLNDEYVPSQMLLKSTDVDRTLETAELVLAGLYPPQGDEVWSQKFPWQPIPVHTLPDSIDVLFSKPECPLYDSEFDRVLQMPQIVEFNSNYSALYDYIMRFSGINVTNPDNVRTIYTTFNIMVENNVSLPIWSEPVYPNPMRIPAVFSDVIDTYTFEMKRIMTGPFLNDVLQHMIDVSSLDEQLFLYSAHDSNIAAILHALGVFHPPHLPRFCSAIIFELHQNSSDEQPYIKLWYRIGPEDNNPVLLTIPGCSAECPLSIFESIIRPLISADWVKECYRKERINRTATKILQ